MTGIPGAHIEVSERQLAILELLARWDPDDVYRRHSLRLEGDPAQQATLRWWLPIAYRQHRLVAQERVG